jgi:N-carbamoyl-L-amino-acid hydrolase
METRRDALVAASHLIKSVQQIGLDQPLTGRATVGHIVVTPNSPNVIPGHVELMVEFRNPEVAVLDEMTESLIKVLKETADKYGVGVVSKQELDSATINFTPELIDFVEQAATNCSMTSMRMISGAGHDACQLSAVMPSTMIFIPCDKGISHAENEAITKEWAADGAQVLVETVLAIDSK